MTNSWSILATSPLTDVWLAAIPWSDMTDDKIWPYLLKEVDPGVRKTEAGDLYTQLYDSHLTEYMTFIAD